MQVRQQIDLAPASPVSPGQDAFNAFQGASSLNEMDRAVALFPFMTHPEFIETIAQTIAQRVPLEHKSAFEQRLAWLRQLADEQQ